VVTIAAENSPGRNVNAASTPMSSSRAAMGDSGGHLNYHFDHVNGSGH